MPSIPHWDDPDAPWDKLTLGVHVMPGVWAITGGECARQVDHKKTKDKDGARIRDMGLLPPRLQAVGRLAGRDANGQPNDDWAQLQRIMPDIHPKKPGGIKQPLKIYHPAAALIGVTTVYVERIRPPEIKDGILEFAIDMIEWSAEPKKTNVKPKVTPPTDSEIMVAQLRGAGSWRTSTIQPFISAEDYDADHQPLSNTDTRNPPEATLNRSIDPSSAIAPFLTGQ